MTEILTRDQEVLLNDSFVQRQIKDAGKRGYEDGLMRRPSQPFPPDKELSFTYDQRVLYYDRFVEEQILKAYQKSYTYGWTVRFCG